MNSPRKRKAARKPVRVYLSGGMEYAQFEGAGWREEIEGWIKKYLKHSVFNPNKESARFLRKRVRGDFRKLKTDDTARFSSIVAEIVDLDSAEIAYQSDYVVCYWDRSAQRGAGTKGELTIARLFRKPVYMVTEVRPENIPGWILGCTSRMFATFDELKEFLLETFSGKKSRPKR